MSMGPGREAMFSFGRPRPTRRSLGILPRLGIFICQSASEGRYWAGRGSVGVDKLSTSTEVGDISLT